MTFQAAFSSMIELSSVVNGCSTFIGPASVFPAKFRNVNVRSKKAEKLISFICEMDHAMMINKIDRPNTTPIGRLVLSLTFKVWL